MSWSVIMMLFLTTKASKTTNCYNQSLQEVISLFASVFVFNLPLVFQLVFSAKSSTKLVGVLSWISFHYYYLNFCNFSYYSFLEPIVWLLNSVSRFFHCYHSWKLTDSVWLLCTINQLSSIFRLFYSN